MSNIRRFPARAGEGGSVPEMVARSLHDYTALHLAGIDGARLAIRRERAEIAATIVAGWFVQLAIDAESERLTEMERAYLRRLADTRLDMPGRIALHQCMGQIDAAYEQHTRRG